MQRALLPIALLFSFALGCTVSDERAAHVLKAAGYTEVELGGYAWLDCSEDDSLKTSFTAKGPSGVRVEGAVCCGMLAKNCTLRLD